MRYFKLELPWPPTANHIWENVNIGGKTRTYRSKEYKTFLDGAWAAYHIAKAKGECPSKAIEGDEIHVRLVLFPPNNRRYDVDNRIKAVLDALTHVGLWHDDSQIRSVNAWKWYRAEKEHPRVEVEIRVYPPDPPDDDYGPLEGFGSSANLE